MGESLSRGQGCILAHMARFRFPLKKVEGSDLGFVYRVVTIVTYRCPSTVACKG